VSGELNFRDTTCCVVLRMVLWQLEQHQLDVRLLPQRGGEAEFEGALHASPLRGITRAIARPLDYDQRVLSGTLAYDRCRLEKQRNRCFPTKAVAVWHQLDDRGHMRLVEGYLQEAGSFGNVRSLDRSPRRLFSDPLYAVVGEAAGS